VGEAGSDEYIRCFGVCLGLLSMQLDMLDAFAKLAGARAASTYASYATSTSTSTSTSGGDSNEAALEAAAREREELMFQGRSLSELLTLLWAALIRANAVTWLEVALRPSLGGAEEEMIRAEGLLFQAVAQAAPEVWGGRMRKELVPGSERLSHTSTSPSSPLSPSSSAASDLLLDAITASGVTECTLDEQGRLVEGGEQGGQGQGGLAARIEFVIRASVDLALAEAAAEQQ
jgi:hypothetical protein